MNNEFVAMEKRVCPICLKTHGDAKDAGILLNKRLKPIKEEHTVTGYSLCKEHQELYDDGYVALIGCNSDKSEIYGKTGEGKVDMSGAHRTGNIVHIRYSLANDIFNCEMPTVQPFVFCDEEVIQHLEKMQQEAE